MFFCSLCSKEAGPDPPQSPVLPVRSHVGPVHRPAVPCQPVAHPPQHPLPVQLQLPTGIRHHRLPGTDPAGLHPVSLLSPLTGRDPHQGQAHPQAAPAETQLTPPSAPQHARHQPPAPGSFFRPPGWFVSWGKHVHR